MPFAYINICFINSKQLILDISWKITKSKRHKTGSSASHVIVFFFYIIVTAAEVVMPSNGY